MATVIHKMRSDRDGVKRILQRGKYNSWSMIDR